MPPITGRTRTAALTLAIFLAATSTTWCAITPTGDVSPANPSTWTTSTTAYIGNTTTATVSVSPGSHLQSSTAYLGYTNSAAGTVTIDGAGSGWKNGQLYIGYSGTASVTILNGGTASNSAASLGNNPGSAGSVTIAGIGSLCNIQSSIYVGNSGTGALNINLGGSLTSGVASYSFIGNNPNSSGTATIDGTGSTWTLGSLFVGYSGTGALNVTHGATVTSSGKDSAIGWNSGSTGTVTIDGTGSTWITTFGALYVGQSGDGILNIFNGGKVTLAGPTCLASDPTATGLINFGPHGGTLTTTALFAGPTQLTGTGTIKSRGLVSDLHLVFDASHGLNQNLFLATASQNVSLNLDLSGASGTPDVLGAGYRAAGTLSIQNGLNVPSAAGYLGYNPGASGNATISGTGSTWANSASLWIGYSGTGTLNVFSGGKVLGNSAYFGYYPAAAGTATVDGPGSLLSASSLYVGYIGNGLLNVLQGGSVSGFIVLGSQAGAVGTACVDGLNSQLGPSLWVGDAGVGSLTISNGGRVTTPLNSYISYGKGTGAVLVDGTSSLWTTGLLYVGYRMVGSLTIKNGGVVNSTVGAYLGYYSTATASALVEGTGSCWNVGPLVMYGDGSGSLSISSGGHVNSTGSVAIGGSVGSAGRITVDGAGSELTITAGLSVGVAGPGTLTITNGAHVQCGSDSYVDNNTIGTSLVSIDGPGSLCNVAQNLYIGDHGSGLVTIANGGQLVISQSIFVASGTASTGSIHFGINGGTLTAAGLLAGASAVTGPGEIHLRGLVSDINLVFDAAHPLTQSFTLPAGPVVHLDLSADSGLPAPLGAGYQSAGTLTFKDATHITSENAYLAYKANSTGAATLSGADTHWNAAYMYVGLSGAGSLSITDGAALNLSGFCLVAYNSGASGSILVQGSGSTFTTAAQLSIAHNGPGTMQVLQGALVTVNGSSPSSVGTSGNGKGLLAVDAATVLFPNAKLNLGGLVAGTLTLANGALVKAKGVTLESPSLLSIAVGDNSLLDVSNATFSNFGTVRLRAVPALTPGDYTPITAASWTGTGTVKPLGGTWNTSSHLFTVYPAANANAATPVPIDPSQTQRILITDSTFGRMEAGFQPTSSSLTLSAAPLPSSQSALLQSTLAAGNTILSGWNFITSGYTPGNLVALSFEIGSGYSSQNMSIWQFNGSAWSALVAPDLSYNGTHASFVVTSLTSYAVASPLIPTTLSSGTTLLTSHNMLPKVTDLTLIGTLNLSGFNQQLNSLSGTSPALLTNTSLTPSTLTLAPISPTNTTFTGNITGNLALTQSGPGATTLSNYQATGPINISAGTLAFSPTPAPRNSPAILLQASSLSLAPHTTLDLSNHDLLIHNANPAQIESLLASAYFFGLWNHPGITSAAAAANPITTLAILSGADYNTFSPTPGLFDGQPVLSTDTVIKYTYAGDLNLDGLVNDDDFGLFSGAYFFTGTGNYAAGDLNFDGLVNDDDFGLFSGNYFFPPASPLSGLSQLSPLEIENQKSQIENPLTSVPEPTTLLLSLATPTLLRRHKRRHPAPLHRE